MCFPHKILRHKIKKCIVLNLSIIFIFHIKRLTVNAFVTESSSGENLKQSGSLVRAVLWSCAITTFLAVVAGEADKNEVLLCTFTLAVTSQALPCRLATVPFSRLFRCERNL
jgi:hypothetical protein